MLSATPTVSHLVLRKNLCHSLTFLAKTQGSYTPPGTNEHYIVHQQHHRKWLFSLRYVMPWWCHTDVLYHWIELWIKDMISAPDFDGLKWTSMHPDSLSQYYYGKTVKSTSRAATTHYLFVSLAGHHEVLHFMVFHQCNPLVHKRTKSFGTRRYYWQGIFGENGRTPLPGDSLPSPFPIIRSTIREIVRMTWKWVGCSIFAENGDLSHDKHKTSWRIDHHTSSSRVTSNCLSPSSSSSTFSFLNFYSLHYFY